MDDYSLVPVEHQPDFENASLVPVDHDPFSDSGTVQQAPFQQPQAQTQQTQPQQSATGVGRLYVGPAAKIAQASEEGESWDPDSETNATSIPDQSVASTPAKDKPAPDLSHFIPLGELKPATFTPTQQIGNHALDALLDLGVPLHNAQELTKRIGNLLSLTPLGVAGSFLNLIDAKRRDDLPGGVEAAIGLIPGAKGVGRVAAGEVRALTSKVRLNPASWAAKKGYAGVGTTANGGPTFAGTEHLYPAAEGQRNIVKIKLTGSRRGDFRLANQEGKFAETPVGYSWHHVDDFEPISGEASLELVKQEAHESAYPHTGSVAQYAKHHGVRYRP
ncbi:HNH endonuclease [Bradyrhizobium sp. OK095]|uniref:HNH endonuclease signature motif containing protein n=1 Tax=Bradyrhizobium sp. OK095 TaxID=1882760 RepID=UPI0008AF4C1F|nr:HNH endonuclease [Bradyrhizobium sp. OK095]SEM30994.1 A nuclease of the HNH/ENDO VII superfamily with conserved WHH [Bradyrhizobium sp. OK095]